MRPMAIRDKDRGGQAQLRARPEQAFNLGKFREGQSRKAAWRWGHWSWRWKEVGVDHWWVGPVGWVNPSCASICCTFLDSPTLFQRKENFYAPALAIHICIILLPFQWPLFPSPGIKAGWSYDLNDLIQALKCVRDHEGCASLPFPLSFPFSLSLSH